MSGLHLLVSARWWYSGACEAVCGVSYEPPWTGPASASLEEGFSVFVPAPYMAWEAVWRANKLRNYYIVRGDDFINVYIGELKEFYLFNPNKVGRDTYLQIMVTSPILQHFIFSLFKMIFLFCIIHYYHVSVERFVQCCQAASWFWGDLPGKPYNCTSNSSSMQHLY